MRVLFIFIFVSIQLPLNGQFTIGTQNIIYTDPARANRQIPAEVYYPATNAGNLSPIAQGEFPTIVFGHGFTVDISEYQVWVDSLVPCGYIVILPDTENGFSPSHLDFGLDMSFLVDQFIFENSDPNSFFLNALNLNFAVMGHSMGGGSAFLAAETNININTLVTFAAAETNPSAITAAANITIPSLTLAASLDCVAPPPNHQLLMYQALNSNYKAYIEITNASHCQFGAASFFSNCVLAEAFACGGSAANFISTTNQHEQMIASSKPWLDYYLKGDCDAYDQFYNYMTNSTNHTYQEMGTDGCSCPITINIPGIIPSGLYESVQTINSNGIVPAGNNVSFGAGSEISLDIGFEVNAMGDFEALIQSCQ